jgi:GTP pyrophosphokinase
MRRSESASPHWGYKEQRNPAEIRVRLQRIVDWQTETTDPTEFMQSLKIDLEQDKCSSSLPRDGSSRSRRATWSTSRTIHTRSVIDASAPGQLRLAPLDSALQSGDTCEIHEQGRRRGPT